MPVLATPEAEEAFTDSLLKALPAVVRIGPYDFRILRRSHNNGSSEGRYGNNSTIEQSITIHAGAASRYKLVDTFWHEVWHGVYWVWDVDKEDDEEALVSKLGTATCALYRDNPWILGWLKKADL